jgi:site-specific DNA-methyltransferase (adenine-specific)
MIELNKVYNEDNLTLMKQMDSRSVDLIYCDILYGTGRNFGEYQDLIADRQIIADFYMPRFIEMNRILKDTGNIFIQCDWRIVHWVRILLDSAFGYENFCNEIIWAYNSAPRKKDRLGNRHDNVLWYQKTDEHYFNSEEPLIREPYSLSAPRGYEKEKYYNPLGKVIGDVWNINIIGQNDKTERTGYPTQKPIPLLERIVVPFCPEGGIVADFFCGSGTTLVVAKNRGMNYIGCDISEEACRISEERLQ